jgi:hypothetical protein
MMMMGTARISLLPGIWTCCGQPCNHNHPQCPFFEGSDYYTRPSIEEIGCEQIDEHTTEVYYPQSSELLQKLQDYTNGISKTKIDFVTLPSNPTPYSLGLNLPSELSFSPVKYPCGKPYNGPCGIEFTE